MAKYENLNLATNNNEQVIHINRMKMRITYLKKFKILLLYNSNNGKMWYQMLTV
jgi:hypothetical protein